jgi:hypothetical protein
MSIYVDSPGAALSPIPAPSPPPASCGRCGAETRAPECCNYSRHGQTCGRVLCARCAFWPAPEIVHCKEHWL